MQEIKKQSIVIASILKPVDDTRIFEKMGSTLLTTGRWDVHIIGYGNSLHSNAVHFYPLGNFNRISIARVLAPLKVLFILFKVRPGVLIISTHELLIVAAIFKLFFKCKVVYDVMENYFLNIIHTHAFPPPLKYEIALWVRLKEWITRPLITHYLLAESAYREELPFIGNKFTIVENKCVKPDHIQKNTDPAKIRLLFSGTIDSSTGIWEAISLSKLLYEIDNRVELHIVGYCSRERLRNEILNEIGSLQFITCPALDKLVGHNIILEEIRKATAGVVFYPYSVHNKNRIPTKIYEYLGYRLPVLFDTSAVWKDLIIKNRAGIELDFRNPNLKEILNLLNTTDFYPQAVINVYWDSEVEKFLKAIS